MSQSTAKGEKSRYRETLNLPKTDFPMRANLVQNEPQSIKRWTSAGLYERIQADRARHGVGRFVFHDGPPYANGSIHLGHMLNKCLKDFVVRTRLMAGLACPYVPGWDCHGLPIEHKVMQELSAAGKLEKLAGLEEDTRRMAIRRECQKYAEKYVKLQAGQMQRLLTLADYDHPYRTMDPVYEGAVLEVFADLVDRGLVYRQLKAVHWSVANETALAEAELEYMDREDISVYVDFEATDADAVYAAFGLDEDSRPPAGPSFMIWTTTPWTLPANLAIAVHADFEYVLARIDGNVTVLARELLGKVAKLAKAEEVEELAVTTGRKLVGLRYRHPFVKNGPDFSKQPDAAMRGAEPAGIYRVVAAEYVTLEDGTGLVHTAPGHGAEDYMTGLREKLPVYCPVRENGVYDESVPEFLRGVSVWDANEQITELLKESGHLFFSHRFMHSYPHDWRGKTPVIFRATEQWFIGVDQTVGDSGRTLREMGVGATEPGGESSVRFVPEWGRNRLRGMLESRPDWCISRQRAWGLPIPAFYAEVNGETVTLLTPASVRAVAKAFREKGSDAWFQQTPAELLRHYDYDGDDAAPKGLDLNALKKSTDIFDVWFESGTSWNGVMRERSGGGDYPVDLYLEGSDQHRGWFQASLLPGLGATGKPPFRTLLTHGFCVDKDGKKMSKSLGNTLEVEDLLKEFGADVCRWWVAATPYEHDIKTDIEFFKTSGESYRKVRNTLRFMLSNLADYDHANRHEAGELEPASVDAWAMSMFDRLGEQVRAAYEAYDFQKAVSALYNFCNDTLSAVYLAAVKDRLYCDRLDAPRRRRTQRVLYDITDGLCRLLAPLLPHTADEAYRALIGADADACVHMATFAGASGVAADEAWPRVMDLRDRALLALEKVRAEGELENPLDAGMVLPDAEGVLSRFDPVDLADLLGVSRVEIDGNAAEPRVLDLRGEPRCERSWKRDGTVRERSDGGMLSQRDAEALGLA